jgi:N,N-dimethylformamidase beta subunit-like protein/NHL repeat-containing protein
MGSTPDAGFFPARESPIEAENRRDGSTGWKLTRSTRGVWAYVDAASYAPGEKVGVRVAATVATTATWELWRMGWYGGARGRKVLEGGAFAVPVAAAARMDVGTGGVSAGWDTALSFDVPDDAVTGVYLVKITTAAPAQTYALLVVREATPGAPILVPLAVNTYQAYNDWGGTSLYVNTRGDWAAAHAYTASFDRPYAHDAGVGLFFFYDQDFVSFVEAQGYDVAYTTDVDLDADETQAERRRLVVIEGHSEYWSAGMRARVERAIADGTNVAFFGANDCYWQVRYGPADDGRPRRWLIGYKDLAGLDPANGYDPAHVTTQWRLPPVSRPEDAMIGEMYGDDWLWTASPILVTDPNAWVWSGTGARQGTLIGGGYGVESDRMVAEGAAPPGVAELASSVVENHAAALSRAQTVTYPAPSGAVVFAGGSLGWSPLLAHEGTWDPRVQIATANLFSRLAGDGNLGPDNMRDLGLAPPVAPRYRAGVQVSTVTSALRAPVAVAVAVAGDAIVLDGDQVLRVRDDGSVTVVGGGFAGARGLAAAPDGTIYVADTPRNRIRKIDPTGTLATLAGSTVGFADGPGATAQFSEPTGLARLPDGTLLVADTWNHRIRAVAANGTVTTWAGNGLRQVSNGPGASASFYVPFGVAARPDGSAVVVESDTGVVRQIGADPDHTVSILAGGAARPGWQDGTVDVAGVHEVMAVAAGPGMDVVLMDGATYRIRILHAGSIDTLAGGTTAAAVDGDGASAGFALPRAAALAADGSLLVVDVGNHALRRIVLP